MSEVHLDCCDHVLQQLRPGICRQDLGVAFIVSNWLAGFIEFDIAADDLFTAALSDLSTKG